ncbi:nibrin-like [Argonauta hians]
MSWCLENQLSGTDDLKILGWGEFTVGRKDCNLNIGNDKTVSRKHAIISVAQNNIPFSKSNLTIQDVSSYGTYINRKKCDPNTQISLKEGDKLMFGSPNSTFRIWFRPLTVTSSCLKNEAKSELEQIIKYFNGCIDNEWSPRCSFLVMNYLSVTVKVVCALAAQCHIVTIDYFKSLKAATEKCRPLQDPKHFIPKMSNSIMKNETFAPTPSRKTVFNGITFYFFKSSQLKKMKMAIELAGGATSFCDTSSSVEDATFLKDTSIVMQTEPSESKWISHIQSLLQQHDKRMISDAEIGQAILACSTDMYCNPNATLVKTFSQLQSQTMAFQSQQNFNTPTQHTSIIAHRSNNSNATKKQETLSTQVKITDLLCGSKDTSYSNGANKKRNRSPNRLESSLPADEVCVLETSKKKSKLFSESAPCNVIKPSRSVVAKEPSRSVLVPESLSQAPFEHLKPILVIEDSDPESILSENEDEKNQCSKNDTNTMADKSKQLSSIMDSEITEAISDTEGPTEIPTPVVIKQEVDDSGYEPKQGLKPCVLDLSTEDTEMNANQENLSDSQSKYTDVYIKPGFLNKKLNKITPLIEVKEEKDQPRTYTNITFTSLICSRPECETVKKKTGGKDVPDGFVYYKGELVRNYKRFHKNTNCGACSLPQIIGGSSLVAHDVLYTKEFEQLFEASQREEQEENEENRRMDKLFDWGPSKKKNKKSIWDMLK